MRFAALTLFSFFLPTLFAQTDTASVLRDLDSAFVNERINSARSLEFAKKALSGAEKISYWKGISTAHRQIGLVFYNKGEFENALQEFYKSMEIADKKNIVSEKARCNLNTGLVFLDISNYDKALGYFKDGMAICEKYNFKRGLPNFYTNIGIVFDIKEKHDSALFYFNKTLPIYTAANDLMGVANIENNIGSIYKRTKKYKQAKDHYLKSLQITRSYRDIYLSTSYSNLAETELGLGNKSGALLYIDSALATAKGMNSLKELKKVYEKKQLICEQLGDLKESNESFKQILVLRDSLLNEEVQNSIVEMQTKYESEKKERENQLLKQENELKELRIGKDKKQKLYLVIGVIALFIMLALAFFAFWVKVRSSRLLAKTNEQMNKQNSTLKLLNKQLIESEEALQKANDAKEQLLSIVSHDISNPAKALVNYTQGLQKDGHAYTKEELLGSVEKIHKSVNSLNLLLNNLLSWSYLQKENMQANMQELNLHALVKECGDIYAQTATEKQVRIINSVSENAVVLADKNMMSTIIRNLLNNALKFSALGGEVKIALDVQGKILSVSDNGKGMSESAIKKILSENYEQDNSAAESGTGMGLSLVASCIKAQGFKWQIASKENEGTVVSILF